MEIVIVGGDALALRVCEDLCAHGHDVVVLWDDDADLARRAREVGARFIGKRPEEAASLSAAEIERAQTVMALSTSDHRNVQVILRSRDLNPAIRVVMRQFNRDIGRKIEQNLQNCSVLSRSTHAAATYAAAAVDPCCFYALQFPDIEGGVLAGFSRFPARELGVGGWTVREIEERLGIRVLAANDAPAEPASHIREDAELTVFRVVRPDQTRKVKQPFGAAFLLRALDACGRFGRLVRHSDPVVRAVLAAAVTIFTLASIFFAKYMGLAPFMAAYVVWTTMMTMGYGDVALPPGDVPARAVTMFLLISGVAFSGMFIALVTARLTRAQWTSLHGLRKFHRHGHFVVCGAGQVGSRVIDFLLHMNQSVAVIESNPGVQIIQRSRERHFDLLTGDATDSDVLTLCNVEHARGLIALTESDTMNLETALSARAHNASLPVVMRVNEVGLADSMKRHFSLDHTFDAAALTAAVFAGLAFHPGSRGRVEIGGNEYAISERDATDIAPIGMARQGIPLCVRRNGAIVLARDLGEIMEDDRVLLLYPLVEA
jgi:Trk K+ transport system NAD-binding subunit